MSLKLRKYVKNDIPISFMQNLTTAPKMPRILLLFPKRTVLCFLQFRFLDASKGHGSGVSRRPEATEGDALRRNKRCFFPAIGIPRF